MLITLSLHQGSFSCCEVKGRRRQTNNYVPNKILPTSSLALYNLYFSCIKRSKKHQGVNKLRKKLPLYIVVSLADPLPTAHCTSNNGHCKPIRSPTWPHELSNLITAHANSPQTAGMQRCTKLRTFASQRGIVVTSPFCLLGFRARTIE